MNRLLILCGPTASGKSSCALTLCKLLVAELVSCDSMQLYRGMDIGTAKPTPAERKLVPHHLLDVLDPTEKCSAVRYRDLAKPVINSLFSKGIQPVLCGGTGLYIDALTKPRSFSIEGDPILREELTSMGKQSLHDMLTQFDPDSAARLHVNDVRRVMRAVEVYRLTGRTLTEHLRKDTQKPGDYEAMLFALDWPRELLYERIDRRVDEMMEAGWIDEVKHLLNASFPTSSTALQAIGYKEIIAALSGKTNMENAINQIKQATRNYAKRQLTWFRRDDRVRWIKAETRSIDSISSEMLDIWRGSAQ